MQLNIFLNFHTLSENHMLNLEIELFDNNLKNNVNNLDVFIQGSAI